MSKFISRAVVGLISFFCIFFATNAASQTVIPDTVRLGVRNTVPIIGDVREVGGQRIASGFCGVFGQQLQAELRQTNQKATVAYRLIQNQYLGDLYPRWGSLLTQDSRDRLDMQCGPNSRQEVKDNLVIFSDFNFYETGIKLLLRKDVADEYLNRASNNNLLELVEEVIKPRISIAAVTETTTLERLKSSGFRAYNYSTRDEALSALEEDKVQAFASDGIILRALLKEGNVGGRTYEDKGYVLFPENSGYLLGKSENYTIAISNEGKNAQYSAELLSATNRVLNQPELREDERLKLEEYEFGQSEPNNNLSKYFLLGVSVLGAVIIAAIFLFRSRKPSPRTRQKGSDVTIQHLTIHNINMSQELVYASPQIQELVEQLQRQGVTASTAQEQVAQSIAAQAQRTPTMRDQLIKWGQSLAETTVSDVAKEVVKLAIRLAGIPLP